MNPIILLVDDEESIHKVVKRALKESGVEVQSAYDGEAALAMAKGRNYGLVLLDINMPVKNGYEVMRELRRDRQTASIPVCMLTGNGEMVDRIVGYELGVQDYITKPFDVFEFRRRVFLELRP